ncbi:hypothetical protein BDN70DRAFT_128426 [Pholiota conissans]|uniref:Uncharacterized protein n=1 Tax=Pholiota conissans TaxID=109636 RepID=A0A9P6CZ14_9AGAR|nr:hypothetical protein BDN70DRAFT_128426 [Pholiota conissans]
MAACKAFTYPISSNASLQAELRQTLLSTVGLNVTSALDDNDPLLANVFCSADAALQCLGICPNADLAGVGVRAAFWISSILQAVLVAVSPENSAEGSWSAALLSASVIVAAFSQKRQHQLSIYHATLVLNFATFSSLVSLAVAPMCTVWRESTEEDEDDTLRPAPEDEVTILGEEGEPVVDSALPLSNLPQRKSHRQRLILSLILVTQVTLQWTWVAMLFTDPLYAQKACTSSTVVLLFGNPFTVRDINHHHFFVWPLWLLFNLSMTLVWGALLVCNSSPAVHPVLSHAPSRRESTESLAAQDKDSKRPFFSIDAGRMLVLFGNIMAFFLASFFLVSSEVQVSQNCVLGGENTAWSFGQIAALLVSLAPTWPIVAALHKKTQRFQSRHGYGILGSHSSSECDTPSPSPYTPTNGTQTPSNNSQSPDNHSGSSQYIDVELLAVPETPDFRQRSRRTTRYFYDSP